MGAAAQRLPHIDEHSIVVGAPPGATWEALLRTLERSAEAGAASGLAQVLGCEDTVASGPRPLAEGAAIPGFHVAAAQPPRELSLLGGHRFSSYALSFRLEPAGGGRTRLRAETRAEFPGRRGTAYRALVIGTRGHVLAAKRILRAVRRRAEKP
jgi:hypothetical protein